MRTEVPYLVPFVGAEPVDLMLDLGGGGVVVDDPFPVLVGLCFEAGPGSGEDVRCRVVRRRDDRNHAGPMSSRVMP